jgi:plastocyanin
MTTLRNDVARSVLSALTMFRRGTTPADIAATVTRALDIADVAIAASTDPVELTTAGACLVSIAEYIRDPAPIPTATAVALALQYAIELESQSPEGPGTQFDAVLGFFTSDLSLVTAAPQIIAPGNSAVTTLASVNRAAIRFPSLASIVGIEVSYKGDVSNVTPGQTVEFAAQLSTDHRATFQDIVGTVLSGPSDLAGYHELSATFASVAIPAGSFLDVRVTPALGLTGALTDISVTLISG